MNNPLSLMQAMRNPQAFMQNVMQNSQIMQNPMAKNVIEMAQNGDLSGIEQFGRNIAKERGVDFDKAFSDFKRQFPMGR